jgi:hypothetical protein
MSGEAPSFCCCHSDYSRKYSEVVVRSPHRQALEAYQAKVLQIFQENSPQTKFPELACAKICPSGAQFEVKIVASSEAQATLLLGACDGMTREGEGVHAVLETLETFYPPEGYKEKTQEERKAWLIECAQQRPDLIGRISNLSDFILKFGITDSGCKVEILLAFSKIHHGVLSLLCGHQDHPDFQRILMNCAAAYPQHMLEFTELVPKLPPDKRLIVALACAGHSKEKTLRLIDSFSLTTKEKAAVRAACQPPAEPTEATTAKTSEEAEGVEEPSPYEVGKVVLGLELPIVRTAGPWSLDAIKELFKKDSVTEEQVLAILAAVPFMHPEIRAEATLLCAQQYPDLVLGNIPQGLSAKEESLLKEVCRGWIT